MTGRNERGEVGTGTVPWGNRGGGGELGGPPGAKKRVQKNK